MNVAIDVAAWLGRFGSSLLSVFIPVLAFVAAGWIGTRVAERTRSTAWGWIVGIAALVLLVTMLWPAHNALKAQGCKGDRDFRACMDDDGESDN